MPDLSDEIERIVREKFLYLFPYYGQVKDAIPDNTGIILVSIPSLGWDTADNYKKCYPAQIHSQITPKIDEWVVVRFTGIEMEIGRYEYIASEMKNMIPEEYKGPDDNIVFQDPETKDYIKYDSKNKELFIKISGNSTINIDGDAKITATKFNVNDRLTVE